MNRIEVDFGQMGELRGFRARVEAKKCSRIGSSSEEEEGSDCEGKEEKGGEFEEIERDPVGEIEGFGFREGISEWDLMGFGVLTILNQHGKY